MFCGHANDRIYLRLLRLGAGIAKLPHGNLRQLGKQGVVVAGRVWRPQLDDLQGGVVHALYELGAATVQSSTVPSVWSVI